jgi:hypothetical protein
MIPNHPIKPVGIEMIPNTREAVAIPFFFGAVVSDIIDCFVFIS